MSTAFSNFAVFVWLSLVCILFWRSSLMTGSICWLRGNDDGDSDAGNSGSGGAGSSGCGDDPVEDGDGDSDAVEDDDRILVGLSGDGSDVLYSVQLSEERLILLASAAYTVCKLYSGDIVSIAHEVIDGGVYCGDDTRKKVLDCCRELQRLMVDNSDYLIDGDKAEELHACHLDLIEGCYKLNGIDTCEFLEDGDAASGCTLVCATSSGITDGLDCGFDTMTYGVGNSCDDDIPAIDKSSADNPPILGKPKVVGGSSYSRIGRSRCEHCDKRRVLYCYPFSQGWGEEDILLSLCSGCIDKMEDKSGGV